MKVRRYIKFYKLSLRKGFSTYGLMCNRTKWQAFKFGLRHIIRGKAFFFRYKLYQ